MSDSSRKKAPSTEENPPPPKSEKSGKENPRKTKSNPGRGLGRGLGDLLAQHDTDLPFLGAYGAASGEHQEGLPASAGEDNQGELLKAILRHLRSELGSDAVIDGEGLVMVEGEWLRAEVSAKGGVLIDVKGEFPLPLVPSDLQSPGMVDGELRSDRLAASVRLVQWGIESRRFFSRLCEFSTMK